MDAGTKTFFRLGQSIEHEIKKHYTLPPKDFGKWARVCEHIIRHYTEGWADGYQLDMPYWEIWNEPDLHPQCWDGTNEAFYELYDITSRHLKACFPHLKIGGPAVTSAGNNDFLIPFFEYLTRDKNDPAPMDFFSFHIYTTTPEAVAAQPVIARNLLGRFGYHSTETILNEWNYVRAWTQEGLYYSYSVIPSLKGSAFVASTMLSCQNTPLDHLMYYDAAMPAAWNGLFDKRTYAPKKPYWSLYAFSRLYLLGTQVVSSSDDASVYCAAAVSDDRTQAAVVLTYYRDLESIDGVGCEDERMELRVNWSGFASDGGVRVTYHLLDAENDLDAVSEETFFGCDCAHIFRLPMYSTVLITLTGL